MFRCENETCGKMSKPRQPVNRVVTARRNKVYEKEIRKRGKVVDIKEIQGWEIVAEINVCPECFQEMTGRKPKLIVETHRPPQRYRGFNAKPPRRKKWQNPSQKKSSRGTEKATRNSGNSRKGPVVEKVNTIRN